MITKQGIKFLAVTTELPNGKLTLAFRHRCSDGSGTQSADRSRNLDCLLKKKKNVRNIKFINLKMRFVNEQKTPACLQTVIITHNKTLNLKKNYHLA
jgi:hypothetical protein